MGIIRLVFKLAAAVAGLFFLVIGLFGFAFEVVVIMASDNRANQVLGRVWFEHDPFLEYLGSPSIQLAQVIFERKLGLDSVWNPGITTLLNWPSWLALVAIGVVGTTVGLILLSMAAPRKRRSGFS